MWGKNLMQATGPLTPEVNEILPTQEFIPRSSSLSEHMSELCRKLELLSLF